MRIMLHSKLECVVTDTNLDYEGSITIDTALLAKNDIFMGEQVHVLNKNNGNRFITYAIPGNGVCLNGAAARMGIVGDSLIVLTYEII